MPTPGHAAPERIAVNRVPVSPEPARRRVIREGFNDLLCSPRGGRMVGDREMGDAPAMVREQYEDEEHAARDGRDREEVHRDQRGHVVGEEGAPGLARWVVSPTEESRNGALGD